MSSAKWLMGTPVRCPTLNISSITLNMFFQRIYVFIFDFASIMPSTAIRIIQQIIHKCIQFKMHSTKQWGKELKMKRNGPNTELRKRENMYVIYNPSPPY